MPIPEREGCFGPRMTWWPLIAIHESDALSRHRGAMLLLQASSYNKHVAACCMCSACAKRHGRHGTW